MIYRCLNTVARNEYSQIHFSYQAIMVNRMIYFVNQTHNQDNFIFQVCNEIQLNF